MAIGTHPIAAARANGSHAATEAMLMGLDNQHFSNQTMTYDIKFSSYVINFFTEALDLKLLSHRLLILFDEQSSKDIIYGMLMPSIFCTYIFFLSYLYQQTLNYFAVV